MKKVLKKASKRIPTKRKIKSIKRLHGMSWVSILLLVLALSLVFGGFLFLPSSKYPPITGNVIKIPDENCNKDGNDNLQLCTFFIVTLTPTPKPTPESTSRSVEKSGGGSSNKSSKRESSSGSSGGSSSPKSGGSSSGGGSGGSSGGGGGAPPL